MSDQALSLNVAVPADGGWDRLSIECVTFDTSGRPKQRRLRSLLSMLQPIPKGADQTLAAASGTAGY